MKEFANLTLMALMTAVKENRERGGRRQTYLVIDEFQQMASESFKRCCVKPGALGSL